MKRLLLTIVGVWGLLAVAARNYDFTAQRISTVDGLPTNIVSRIWQTQDGYMWFETRSGVCRYDGYAVQVFEKGTTSVPEMEKQLRTRDAEWRREGKGRLARHGRDGGRQSWQLIPEDVINYTRADHFHVADVDERTEAITTYGSGLYLYDKPTGELTRIANGVVGTPYLTGLFVDRTGCIWMVEDYLGVKCLRRNGLHYVRHALAKESPIRDANHVRCLAQMGDATLLCSNQMSDIYHIDMASGRVSFTRNMGKRVYAALTDREGNEWMGTRGAGLFKNRQHIEGLPTQNIFQLREDQKDGVWVAMYEGGIVHLRVNGDRDTFLDGKNCHDLVSDEEGNLWVAAEDSLYMIKGGRAVPAMRGFFVCLLRDRSNTIWAGSIGSGLVRCSDGKSFTVKSGLENDNIYSLVQDRQGMLWLGTEGGLSCLNPQTEDIQNHHFSDSQLANVFSEHAALALPDGRLLFGTHDGIVEVEPLSLERVSSSPQTVVTGFRVNGTQSELDACLSYTDNNLTFLFSNFQYSTLGSVLYQYKLEGVDNDWSLPTKDHSAMYRQLAPGHYTFRVRSNNGKGVWGEETMVEFAIGQPWWNTWWAWLAYLTVVAASVWLAVRFLLIHRKLDMERRVSAFKRDFYNRIERELRNPVNVLQGAAENVQATGTSKTTVQSLRRGSRRMLKLMDMIEQFHRLDDMEMQVKAEQDAMNEEAEQRFLDIRNSIHAEEHEYLELAPPPINEQSVVIVEEDEDNLTHLTDTLNPYFRISGCQTLAECEGMIRERQPSVLLMDTTDDEKGCLELTRRLHQEMPLLPVVHLSSYSDDAHQLRSLRSGASDFIAKPFSGKVLLERVTRLLEHMGKGEVAPDGKGGGVGAPHEHLAKTGLLTNAKDKHFLDLFHTLLSQHIADENFSVEQFAEMMHLGRTQFYKRVKALTGETPVQHLHRARLQFAARLLCGSQMTVEEAMTRAGFNSPTHFYSSFKQQFGMSPSEYRHQEGLKTSWIED